jgi:hypothetical protein
MLMIIDHVSTGQPDISVADPRPIGIGPDPAFYLNTDSAFNLYADQHFSH